MVSLDEESKKSKYKKETVDETIKHYHKKGSHRINAFFWGQAFIIGLGAFIPVTTILPQIQVLDAIEYQFLVATLGAVIALIGGLLQRVQYLEAFRIYRRGRTLLQSETRLYEQSCGDYFKVDEASKWDKYVQEVERIIRETDEERLARYGD